MEQILRTPETGHISSWLESNCTDENYKLMLQNLKWNSNANSRILRKRRKYFKKQKISLNAYQLWAGLKELEASAVCQSIYNQYHLAIPVLQVESQNFKSREAWKFIGHNSKTKKTVTGVVQPGEDGPWGTQVFIDETINWDTVVEVADIVANLYTRDHRKEEEWLSSVQIALQEEIGIKNISIRKKAGGQMWQNEGLPAGKTKFTYGYPIKQEGLFWFTPNPTTLHYKLVDKVQSTETENVATLEDLKTRLDEIKTTYGGLLADPLTPVNCPAILSVKFKPTSSFLHQLIYVEQLLNRAPSLQTLEKEIVKLEEAYDKAIAYSWAKGIYVWDAKEQETLTKYRKTITKAVGNVNENEKATAYLKSLDILEKIIPVPEQLQNTLNPQKELENLN